MQALDNGDGTAVISDPDPTSIVDNGDGHTATVIDRDDVIIDNLDGTISIPSAILSVSVSVRPDGTPISLIR